MQSLRCFGNWLQFNLLQALPMEIDFLSVSLHSHPLQSLAVVVPPWLVLERFFSFFLNIKFRHQHIGKMMVETVYEDMAETVHVLNLPSPLCASSPASVDRIAGSALHSAVCDVWIIENWRTIENQLLETVPLSLRFPSELVFVFHGSNCMSGVDRFILADTSHTSCWHIAIDIIVFSCVCTYWTGPR